MEITLFKDTTYTVWTLIEEIRRGEIALPDIQRPFVWRATDVRDLLDSMYRGYPVGYLLFWSTGAEVGTRSIGTDAKESAPRLMIVDGQQRLTALYAVLTRRPILRDDFTEARIRIAFRPRDQRFEVTDAAIEKDPEYIPDISVLWDGGGIRKVARTFTERLEAARGPMSEEEKDRLWDAIDRLANIVNYPFKVIELGSDLDEEQVAEIFVRVNAKGVQLNQADFILTLMSVWWDEGRQALEEFCRAAKTLTPTANSPANPIFAPSPDHLLRVGVGLAFRRGQLRTTYSVLRGRDVDTGEISREIRERQFSLLREAQKDVLDLRNWHEFINAIRLAGYRSHSMIGSHNNLLAAYLIYLVSLRESGVERSKLREVIAQWVLMGSLTSRYSLGFESTVEADLRQLQNANDPESFLSVINRIIDTALTKDFWEIQLPAALESTHPKNPAFLAYQASLVLLGARPLFSDVKIAELFDPSTHAPRSAIQPQRFFPRRYLEKLGFHQRMCNQVANSVFMSLPEGMVVKDQPPSEYFLPLFAELSPQDQERARFWHALPDGWETMEYAEFLQERRRLMAKVIRTAFETLRRGEASLIEAEPTEVVLPSVEPSWTLEDLVASEESDSLEFKASAFFSYKPDVPEKAVIEGVIKTVAAFLNTDGGTLVIGVSDDHEILGIQPDLDQKGMDVDRYINALSTHLVSALGAAAAARARIRVHEIEGEQICTVTVPPSPEPVYAKTSKGDQVFYARINNTTRIIEGRELVSYVKDKWG